VAETQEASMKKIIRNLIGERDLQKKIDNVVAEIDKGIDQRRFNLSKLQKDYDNLKEKVKNDVVDPTVCVNLINVKHEIHEEERLLYSFKQLKAMLEA
jgi:hypothetical protein